MKKIKNSSRIILATTAFLSLLILFSSPMSVGVAQSASSEATYAYITNGGSNTVSVIDTATNTVIATVNVGDRPQGVAVSPDGTAVYVTNYGGTVSVIDTATNKVTSTVSVGTNPNGIAVTADGEKVYVTNYGGNTVSVIDTASNTVAATVTVGNNPFGIAVSGSEAYVTNDRDRTISIIDTGTDAVKATVNLVDEFPGGIAVKGSEVYVTNGGTNNVSVIDTNTNVVTATVPVGTNPHGVAIAGTSLYVANLGSNTVSVIDTGSNAVTATVNVGSKPYGIAVTPDGESVYVTNDGSGTVSVIDTATNKVTATVPVGNLPKAFGQFIGTVPVFETENNEVEEPENIEEFEDIEESEYIEEPEDTGAGQTENTQTNIVNYYNDNTETNTETNTQTTTINNYYNAEPAEKSEIPEAEQDKDTSEEDSEESSASVSLHGEKTEVLRGEDILLRLSAVNLITKPTMHVQVIIIPPSGMSVSSTEFVESGAGQYTTTYELEPGKGRDIEVRIAANQVGDFNVKGRVVYFFGDNTKEGDDYTLDLPIKVADPNPQPTIEGKTITIPDVPGIGIPGMVFILMLVFVLRRN
jgi:YVTN family beta-propeller protein